MPTIVVLIASVLATTALAHCEAGRINQDAHQ
jgi:hypothetical protein